MMRKTVVIMLLILLTACQGKTRDLHQEKAGYSFSDWLGAEEAVVLDQIHKAGIEYEIHDSIHINIYNYLDCHLKEEINGLEYRVNLQFGSWDEEGPSTLQLCTRSFECDSWPEDETLEALQKTLNALCKKYGNPDAVHCQEDVDVINLYQEKTEDQPIHMEWDEGVHLSTYYGSGDFRFNWMEMSEDYYSRWGLS